MLRLLAFSLLLTIWPAQCVAQTDLGFLDNLINSITPKEGDKAEKKKVSALQRELRKAVKNVEHRYDRIFDPAGLNQHKPQKSRQIRRNRQINEEQLERMVAKLKSSCKKPATDAQLKAILRSYLGKKGVKVASRKRRVRVQEASKLSQLSNWLSGLYGELTSKQ